MPHCSLICAIYIFFTVNLHALVIYRRILYFESKYLIDYCYTVKKSVKLTGHFTKVSVKNMSENYLLIQQKCSAEINCLYTVKNLC